MQMKVHLLVQKSAQNDSIKSGFKEEIYVVLEGATKNSF